MSNLLNTNVINFSFHTSLPQHLLSGQDVYGLVSFVGLPNLTNMEKTQTILPPERSLHSLNRFYSKHWHEINVKSTEIVEKKFVIDFRAVSFLVDLFHVKHKKM